MTTMKPEELLDRAMAAFQAGRREEARELLVDVLALEPGYLEAWLRLADLAATPERATLYLQRALAIDPSSVRVQSRLEQIRGQSQGPEVPALHEATAPSSTPETPAPPVAREVPRVTPRPPAPATFIPHPESPIFATEDTVPFTLDLEEALGQKPPEKVASGSDGQSFLPEDANKGSQDQ